MNTLNGYSKSTLSDSYLLKAGGGHIAVGNASGNVPLSNGTVCTNLNADKVDGKNATDFLLYYEKNYGANISNVKDIDTTLTSGLARIHISNVEYSSVLTGYDYNSRYWQLRFVPGAAKGLYYRNTTSGTEWQLLAFVSDIPTVTNYYWANVKIKSSEDKTTVPTFGGINSTGTITDSSTQPLAFTSTGTGVYTRAALIHNTSGTVFERARATESSSGTILPFIISLRGGGTAASFEGNNLYIAGKVGIGTSVSTNALDVKGSVIFQNNTDLVTFSLKGPNSKLAMLTWSDSNYIESGNSDFSKNLPLKLTGILGGLGSDLYLNFANIYCRAGYTNIDANNYTTYTVTKTGGGASGTWGINISGDASTLRSLAPVHNKLYYNYKSVTMSTTLKVWYIKIVLSGYALPCLFIISGSYNNQIDRAIIETSGMSLGYIYRNCNQNDGNITGVWHKANYDSTEKLWIFWVRLKAIQDSTTSHYSPASSATYTVYMGENNTSFSVTATTTEPSGANWTNAAGGGNNSIIIKNGTLYGTASSATNADTLDGYHSSAFLLAGDYLINHGMSNSRPNGTTFTLPGGSNGVSMRSKATSGNDIGIFLLTDDNAFICNSSDNNYLFATFDTDKTADFSSANNAAFAVLSDHAGVSIKGLVTMDGYFNIRSHYFFVRDNANADWVVTDKSWQHEYAIIHSGNIGSQSVNYATSAGNASTLDSLDSTDFLRNVNLNGTFSSAANIPTNLTAGVHRLHIPGVEYSSILTGYDQPGNYWQLYFHPCSGYTLDIRYRATNCSTWKTLLDSNNYNSYSPKLNGTGASGTWGINITGSAGSVAWGNITGKPGSFTPASHTHTYIESKANYTFTSSTLPNSFDWGVSAGFVADTSGFGSYGSVLTVRTYSGGGGTLQLYAPYSNTYGGSRLKARFGNYDSNTGNSWTSLKELAWLGDIPSVGNGTVTITLNGTTKGTFTMNQSGNTTIALTDTLPTSTFSSLFINTGDSTLKIYSGRITDARSDGNICLQTCIDGTDGQTHSYAPNYQARENLVLQPRGGLVYIGTNPDGGNTSYKLYVNGTIYGTSFAGNVAWGNITGKPSFFSGNYNDLTNKPTSLPANGGTATASYYVYDYNATTTPIYIGYAGAALSTATHFAAYGTTSSGARCIKDIPVATVKSLLGIPTVSSRNLTVNGTAYTFYSNTTTAAASFYAPTSVGSSYQILVSGGSTSYPTPYWENRMTSTFPGIIWIGYIYRSTRGSTYWYAVREGGYATVSLAISLPTSSNNYLLALQSSTHTILGGTCSIRAQWNAGKDGGQSTEGPLYAYSTVDVSKIEEAGPDVFVTSVYGGKFYLKAMRASDANNSSYYFDGLAYTGAGKDTNALPLARINVILFGY